MKKNKFWLILIAVFLSVVLFLVLRGDEDSWLCQNGQWIKHGNPSKSPPTPCQ